MYKSLMCIKNNHGFNSARYVFEFWLFIIINDILFPVHYINSFQISLMLNLEFHNNIIYTDKRNMIHSVKSFWEVRKDTYGIVNIYHPLE